MSAPSHHLNHCWRVMFCVIHMRAISQLVHVLLFSTMSLNISLLKLLPQLPGTDEWSRPQFAVILKHFFVQSYLLRHWNLLEFFTVHNTYNVIYYDKCHVDSSTQVAVMGGRGFASYRSNAELFISVRSLSWSVKWFWNTPIVYPLTCNDGNRC